jgi:4-hydroxy-tetrahydrodipicolinate synthase
VLGIKEAGGSCDKVAALREALGPDYLILSGDDPLTLPFMSLGGHGVISVGSNLVVADWVQMVRLALDNDFAAAAAINRRYYKLFREMLALAPNPVPVKYALHRCGLLASDRVRLPLAGLDAGQRARMDGALCDAGLLEAAAHR